jgi:parvulin-like peptidyl-prolyl isomerase
MTRSTTRNTYRRLHHRAATPSRAAALLLAAFVLAGAAPDPVVAIRGVDELTAAQVRALIAAQPADQRKKLAADPEALRGLVRDVLLQRAIQEEAAAQKWDTRPEIVAMLARVREGAIVQSFLATQAQVPANYPSDAELQAAYDHARPQLTRPRSYHLAQVFVAISAPSASADAARHGLTTLARDIAAGRASFEAPPKRAAGAQYADLGWVAEPQLQKVAHDAVAGLPEGQISAPVCTQAGCTLLKLIATRPAGPPPLADVRDQLVRLLREQKQKDLAQAYANSLLAKSPVRVDEIQLSHLAAP